MTAALSLADQGFPSTIVEKSSTLGGVAKDLKRTWRGRDVIAYLADLVDKVTQHPDIEVLTESEVKGASGFAANFDVGRL